MSTLRLEFSGWFQCRLATDPDPTDEPRGSSGTTFALAGEPDFDNVIRFNDPPPGTMRPAAPEIGVSVRRVTIGGHAVAGGHPLIGARVDLMDEPRFYSRNRVVADPGFEPIHPIWLRIKGSGVTLERHDPLDPARPNASPWDVEPVLLARHAPRGVVYAPPEMVAASGVSHPAAYLRRRLASLVAAHAGERDDVARLALEKRIREVRATLATRGDRRLIGLKMCQRFDMKLGGKARVSGLAQRSVGVRTAPPWLLRFGLGIWDADALSGFVMGALDLPTGSARGR